MSDEPARPVWLTREQRQALRELMFGNRNDVWQLIAPLVNAWDAAPADPVEAMASALRERWGYKHFVSSETDIPVMLRALGWEANNGS